MILSRRAELQKLRNELKQMQNRINDIKKEEDDYLDNMPEITLGGSRYRIQQDAVNSLENVSSSVGEALDYLDEILNP